MLGTLCSRGTPLHNTAASYDPFVILYSLIDVNSPGRIRISSLSLMVWSSLFAIVIVPWIHTLSR